MMRSTSLFLSATTAMATARYVLPVPAGPMPKVSVFFLIASTYFFCPSVLHLTCRPLYVMATTSRMISPMRSALPSPARSMA